MLSPPDLCTKALDHLVDSDSFPTLIGMLDDEDPRVRVEALHALACDRCKDNECRPEAVDALTAARDADLSSAVRKKAGWYAPGGTIFAKTMSASR